MELVPYTATRTDTYYTISILSDYPHRMLIITFWTNCVVVDMK